MRRRSDRRAPHGDVSATALARLRFIAWARDFVTDPAGFPYVEEYPRVQRTGLAIGFLLSCVAFILALVLLLRLARDDLPDDAAAGALVLLGAYPFAIFFGAVYTESLYLLAAVATIYYFRRRAFWLAAVWGVFGALVRPNGFFLAGPLALAAATVFVPRLAWGRPVFVVGRTSPRGPPVSARSGSSRPLWR